MADEFRSFEGLRRALAETTFDTPPAIVCNAHVTGLSVARALAAHDVPVIAIDRNGKGVAPYSDTVDFAGQVTYPLDDSDGFREDVEAFAAELGHEPVAFPCMDEWVHAFAGTEPEGVRLPFAGRETIDAVLDKESLYAKAEQLGVPYPETYRLSETSTDDAADALGFPLVVKPALKREFEEAVGTNVIEVATARNWPTWPRWPRTPGSTSWHRRRWTSPSGRTARSPPTFPNRVPQLPSSATRGFATRRRSARRVSFARPTTPKSRSAR
nr:hypothetical protein [Haladaptatus sp. R4]